MTAFPNVCFSWLNVGVRLNGSCVKGNALNKFLTIIPLYLGMLLVDYVRLRFLRDFFFFFFPLALDDMGKGWEMPLWMARKWSTKLLISDWLLYVWWGRGKGEDEKCTGSYRKDVFWKRQCFLWLALMNSCSMTATDLVPACLSTE